MKVYFNQSKVPELAGLNRSQRKMVRRRALQMLRETQPSVYGDFRLLTAAAALIAMIIGMVAAHVIHSGHTWILRAIVVAIVAHVGLLLAESFITEHLRPYLRLFREQHGDEIARTT